MLGQGGDLQQFGVQRVVLNRAFHGVRIAHEARAVQCADRLLISQARGDQLASAREAGHQMLLDETESDAQAGIGEAAVDPDGRAARRCAQAAVVVLTAREVVLDAVLAGDLRAHDGGDFLGRCGTVQAGRNQDGDVLTGDAGALEALDERRQSELIRRRTGDVADRDGGAGTPARQFFQRRPGQGLIESPFDSRARVVQRSGPAGFQEVPAGARRRRIFGQLQTEPVPAECQIDVHAPKLAHLPPGGQFA